MAQVLNLETRQNRDADFIQAYVTNGGNATMAAKVVGVSEGSASTIGHRLKSRLLPAIESEARGQLRGYAVSAFHHLKELAESAQSESVRLGALRDLLDRGGYKPVDKQQVEQVSSVENMTDEEIQAELKVLKHQWLAEEGIKPQHH